MNSSVNQIKNLLYFLEGLLAELIYQRSAEGLPIILSEIQDLVTECRGISNIECCLLNVMVNLLF